MRILSPLPSESVIESIERIEREVHSQLIIKSQ